VVVPGTILPLSSPSYPYYAFHLLLLERVSPRSTYFLLLISLDLYEDTNKKELPRIYYFAMDFLLKQLYP